MRAFLLSILLLTATVTFAAPLAQAGPPDVPCTDPLVRECVSWECLQVYPWSRLCQGDVVGFACAIASCEIVVVQPPVECIQVIPWSYLCSGNVQAFVEYWIGPVLA